MAGNINPTRESSDIAKENNCDIVESLTSFLNLDQQIRLKRLVKNAAKNQVSKYWREKVHVVENEVIVEVLDINDNPPEFPNTTIQAKVQENGPMGKYTNLIRA